MTDQIARAIDAAHDMVTFNFSELARANLKVIEAAYYHMDCGVDRENSLKDALTSWAAAVNGEDV